MGWIFGLMGMSFGLMAFERTSKLRRRIAALEKQVFGEEKTSEDYPKKEKEKESDF